MRKLIIAGATLLATLMVLCIFTTPVSAEAAPEWEEGDGWAFGKEVDMEADLADTLEWGKGQLATALNGTVDTLTLEGKVAVYAAFEVTDVTEDEYVVSTRLGVQFMADAHVKVTAQLPNEGVYPFMGDPWSAENTSSKQVSVDLKVDFALVVEGTITLDKATLALKELDYDFKTSAYVSFVAKNIFSEDYDFLGNTTIDYQDYDVLIKMDVNLHALITFDPALNIYDFPLEDGDEWVVDSVANVSGEVSGFFDASGLPEEVEESIFESDIANMTGATEFPIDLGKLTSEDGRITNGALTPFDIPIHAEMECVGVEDGVYEIEMTTDEMTQTIYYSSNDDFLTSLGTDELPIPDEVPLPDDLVEIETMELAEANAAIDSIEEYESTVSAKASGSAGSLASFFFDPPYLGLILIVVSVIVVAGVVFLVIKRKKP